MRSKLIFAAPAMLLLVGAAVSWAVVTGSTERPRAKPVISTSIVGDSPRASDAPVKSKSEGDHEPPAGDLGGYAGTLDERVKRRAAAELARQDDASRRASGALARVEDTRDLQPENAPNAGRKAPTNARAEGKTRSHQPSTWRWNEHAEPCHFKDMARRLASATRYEESLQIMAAFAGAPTYLESAPDELERRAFLGYGTRFNTMAPELSAALFEAFNLSKPGCARQHIIFHIANAMPWDTARPWLETLARGHDGADREDALCALAFSAAPEFIDEFCALAQNRAPVNCYRDVPCGREHDDLCVAQEREYLRSYRCIELLDRGVYFSWHILASGRRRFVWAHTKEAAGPALLKRLLPAWLARYEGHPGSDDMSYRLARIARDEGNTESAFRWAQICSTTPDQDMNDSGALMVLTLAEQVFTISELYCRLAEPSQRARNRNLLQYVLVRRLAAEQGFGAALRELDQFARSDPQLLISRCHAARWAMPPTKGADSGLQTLPADDSLKTVLGEQPPDLALSNPLLYFTSRHADDLPSCDSPGSPPGSPVECIQLPAHNLATQFRAWETLHELQARRDAAIGETRADLEYKIAAVHYHQRILYPVYAVNAINDGLPCLDDSYRALIPEAQTRKERVRQWERAAVPFLDSIGRFEALLAGYPAYGGRDKVLFSLGLAYVKFSQFRPTSLGRGKHVGEGVRAFEQCAREFPHSTLADDAMNAARYWLKHYPELVRQS